jgi:hypothetical protein
MSVSGLQNEISSAKKREADLKDKFDNLKMEKS